MRNPMHLYLSIGSEAKDQLLLQIGPLIQNTICKSVVFENIRWQQWEESG